MTNRSEIVRLAEEHIEAAGAILARAFFDDPLTMQMLPGGPERARLLPAHFTPFVRYGFLCGEVYTTADLAGVAVWLPSEAADVPPDRAAQCGLDAIEAAIGSAAWGRFSHVMDYVAEIHHRVVPERHWYLLLVGIDPPRQSQGIGSTLLRPMLHRADRDQIPCYLETLKPANVPFYRRLGFEAVADEVEPLSGLRCRAMLRSS
jgi:GNAT superfamily N-acetyltransferase